MIHTILIVLCWFFLELLVPCSTHSLTEPFPPGFEPNALFGRPKPFFTKYEERQTTCSLCLLCCHYLWYKMFADCWKFVLSPSSITRGYCHGDYFIKNSWSVAAKKIIILLDLSPYLFHREWCQITSQTKKQQNCFIGFSWSVIQQADINTRDGNSSPHSEAWPLGVCCHSQTRLRDRSDVAGMGPQPESWEGSQYSSSCFPVTKHAYKT